MSKVFIASSDDAAVVTTPTGFAGEAETRSLFDGEQNPIHSHLHRLSRGASMSVGPMQMDCVVYVWTGAVQAGGRPLAAGSSLVVERGASIEISGEDETSQLLTFHAARPPANPRAGGHVHLLPDEHVPRAEMGAPGVIGGMHANGACPTCEVWLHENSVPPRDQTPEDMAKGVHAHTEDEVIFVIGGEMHFGTRVLRPGTAIAISANAFYGFGVGPTGLKFVNFRAGTPSEIRFKMGHTMDEVALWRDSVAAPRYLEPA